MNRRVAGKNQRSMTVVRLLHIGPLPDQNELSPELQRPADDCEINVTMHSSMREPCIG
jgi:hypothetical protein